MKNQEIVILHQEQSSSMHSNEIQSEKIDADVAEIIVCNSDEEKDEISIVNQLESNSNFTINENKTCEKKHLLKNSGLKGLLPPERDKWYLPASNLLDLKRCCTEHCYFAVNSSLGMFNLRNSLSTNENTLQFENENPVEQQTIDLECLASKKEKFESVNDYKTVNEIKEIDLSQGSSNSSVSDNERDFVDYSNERDYCPDDISTGSESENGIVTSDEGNDALEHNQGKSLHSNNSCLKNVFVKNESTCIRRKKSLTFRRVGISNYLAAQKSTPKNFVSVGDILAQIKNMQKVVKAKCDKKYIGDTKKVPPPKLKRMLNKGRHDDFSKMSEFLFPMPNLTKMSLGSKNWKVDYTNDNVQSLGLDDLLLKASELNAENFTKALGRKLDPTKPIFSENDNSEIVLTVPNSNRMSIDGKKISESNGNDFIKKYGLKSIKLDISKPFFECEKKQENGTVLKSVEESSPKSVIKSAIKVKTVENINEEFKDSLELKNKKLKNSSVEEINEKGNKGEGRHNSENSLIEKKDFVGSYEKEGKTEENLMGADEKNKPFIMTIIQGKTEKQRPAILRNSSYFKKRTSSLDSAKEVDKEKSIENKLPSKSSKEGSSEVKKVVENSTDSQCSKLQNLEKNICNESNNSDSVQTKTLNSDTYSKEVIETETECTKSGGENLNNAAFHVKKKKIPFILNHKRKMSQSDTTSQPQPKSSSKSVIKNSEAAGKIQANDKVFKVTSVEQKLGPKEVNKRFIKVVPYEPAKKTSESSKSAATLSRNSDEDSEKNSPKDPKTSPLLSLTAFSTVLREILPDKWFLCLDKKYGLQIIKTQVDEMLNPTILMSVVIGKCGRLTVNVRGKQLDKSHQFFANLCEMGNSENKLSLNYVLAVLNKLRYLSVCFGCDPSLKQYWKENESQKNQTNEFQQIYRSQLCHLLVSLGKKRCYPCYRMNESLKKRYKREKSGEKMKEDSSKDSSPVDANPMAKEYSEEGSKVELHSRGVKRNLEDFLEDSFSTMKQQITNEIEKNKKLGEREKALKAQDEVLSFMGLTRKNSLGNPVRKSKRKKNSFYKLQQPVKKKIDQKELEFLEKYWGDINTLFSTSLLFGAYSRTGRGRLREKCKMFHKLLSTWKDIVKSNPEWIGGDVTLPYIRSVDDGSTEKNGTSDQFEKMDIPALRAYIINSVKEVNRIKHKLRTRNSYFKILYNKFVKRRMKRAKSPGPAEGDKKEKTAHSANTTPTPTDLSSDESSRDKGKTTDEESRAPNESTQVIANLDGD